MSTSKIVILDDFVVSHDCELLALIVWESSGYVVIRRRARMRVWQ